MASVGEMIVDHSSGKEMEQETDTPELLVTNLSSPVVAGDDNRKEENGEGDGNKNEEDQLPHSEELEPSQTSSEDIEVIMEDLGDLPPGVAKTVREVDDWFDVIYGDDGKEFNRFLDDYVMFALTVLVENLNSSKFCNFVIDLPSPPNFRFTKPIYHIAPSPEFLSCLERLVTPLKLPKRIDTKK